MTVPGVGDRVDTPLGLGRVTHVGPIPQLLGGPYVTVVLEAKGMTPGDEPGIFDPADVQVFEAAT